VPIYEYRCPTCGHELSKLQKFDSPPPPCPNCPPPPEGVEASPMEKKLSKSGFKLEGGGWGKDGYG
jgi:putative FmdB family regulatory protein